MRQETLMNEDYDYTNTMSVSIKESFSASGFSGCVLFAFARGPILLKLASHFNITSV